MGGVCTSLRAACDGDDDDDGRKDALDNCPLVSNSQQLDNNGDGLGDECDLDDDADGHVDPTDNCPFVANSNQLDSDGDQAGDICDPDDNDGLLDEIDNCPFAANSDEDDQNDGDGIGSACDPDDDSDTVLDQDDNCPKVSNASQANADGDALGDACDPDSDNDGVPNAIDNCPTTRNADQANKDGTGTEKGVPAIRTTTTTARWTSPPARRRRTRPARRASPHGLQGRGLRRHQGDGEPGGTGDLRRDRQRLRGWDRRGGAQGCATRYEESDKDGYGVTGDSRCLCQPVTPHLAVFDGDCKDSDANVHPNAAEKCDGVDEDCDGTTDEAGSKGCEYKYKDVDTDGWGVAGEKKCVCGAAPPYTAAKSGDCADDDKAVSPAKAEVCHGIDNDCEGGVDEAGAVGCKAHYRDEDGDGFGQTADSKCLCGASGPYATTVDADCYDANPSAHPGQTNYFATHRGGMSYDWSCDSVEERERPAPHAKQCAADGSLTCTDKFCCVSGAGWEISAPVCGDSGQWVLSCSGTFVGPTFVCKLSTEPRTQLCR